MEAEERETSADRRDAPIAEPTVADAYIADARFERVMRRCGKVKALDDVALVNFRSTPISKFELLFGKPVSFVAVGIATFSFGVFTAILVIDAPVRGPFLTLVLGAAAMCFRLPASVSLSRPSPH